MRTSPLFLPRLTPYDSPMFPDLERLDALLGRFPSQRVLVVGDLMLDRYLFGETSRISPEAPVPVIEAKDELLRLGGAANVAHNVKSLGAEPMLVGVLGDDPFGREMGALLEEKGISREFLEIDPARRTTAKTRVLARNQQIVRIDREETAEISGSLLDRLGAGLERAIERASACVVSDYGKGVITRALLARLLPAALRAGVPVAVDPKETHFFEYRGVATITPNLLETSMAFGRKIREESTLLDAGHELRQRLGAKSVLVTRGEQGMTLFEEGRRPRHFPAVAREVFDVTGAGDTVVSTIGVALGAGADLAEAAALANHAAGIVVREVGTAVTNRDDLRAAFLEHGDPEGPIELPWPSGTSSGRA